MADNEDDDRFFETEEERLREWMREDKYNIHTLARWAKHDLWGMSVNQLRDQEDYVERLEASLRYVLRRLSKGYIPKVELVHNMLTGKEAPPACGFLGCFIKDEHVH